MRACKKPHLKTKKEMQVLWEDYAGRNRNFHFSLGKGEEEEK
jgi:hypothetical protein